MDPRLESSMDWTEFPSDYLKVVEDNMREKFAPHVKDCDVIVEGRIYAEELSLRLGILPKGLLRQVNFEASISYDKGTEDVKERIEACLNAASSMMEQYYKTGGDLAIPMSWKPFDFDKFKVYLRHTTVNSTLEKEADLLLGLTDDSLFQEH